MRMALSNKADYAIRAVLDVARHYPNLRTARQITDTMDLPRNFMTQILATLVRHHLLKSTAGPTGGYALARPPTEITLLDVIETMEGPVVTDECVLGGGPCDWTQLCPLHQTWTEARSGVANRLATTTFGNLADIDKAIRAGTYQPPDHAPPHLTTPPRRGTSR
jgi:Rrf2 family protein